MERQVVPAELPDQALLQAYRVEGGYVDCWTAEVPGTISLTTFVTAFYTSRAFRPERWLLGAVLGKRADDQDATRLANGEAERFSAWSVEARRGDELLLCDFQGKTRSWLKVCPIAEGTRLHFGSAVVPARTTADRIVFTALLGFHRLYSRILLRGALRGLEG